MVQKTTAQFKLELLNKFPDLELVGEYTGSKSNVEVSCNKGHTWKVSAGHLLNGIKSKCRICTPYIPHNKKSTTEFKMEILNKFPTLEVLGEYTSSKEYINIKCKVCGATWSVAAADLLRKGTKSVCRSCTPIVAYNRKTHETFVEEVSSLYPHISIIDKYVGARERLAVTSDCTHTWSIEPMTLLSQGINSICPTCFPGNSPDELEVLEYIQSKYSGWIEKNDRSILEGKELDIVLPNLGIAIEYNGIYWHQEDKRGKYFHRDKTNKVLDFGYRLIHINEDEWRLKKEIVKSRLDSLLGVSNRMYARNCTVRTIGYPKEFLENNHLQGAGAPSSYNYGLFNGDELVAAMTFSKPRFSTQYDFELVRYCSKLNTSIVGGASKLLKAFIREHKGSIISYSDRRWSLGNLYTKLGFSHSHTSEPNYRYYKGIKSLSRYKCQKHLLKDLFPISYKQERTEKEIMILEGYYPVYDSGNDVWVKL